jgi:hypothetical protein
MQEIESPVTNELVAKVLLVAPGIGLPFMYHWKVGALPPPEVTVAVKVTVVPVGTVVPGDTEIVPVG